MKTVDYNKIKCKLISFQDEIVKCQLSNMEKYNLVKTLRQYHLEDSQYFKFEKYKDKHHALITMFDEIEKANKKLSKTPHKALQLCKKVENLEYLINNAKISRMVFSSICTEIMAKGKVSDQEMADVEQMLYLTSKVYIGSKQRLQLCVDAVNKASLKELEK